MKKTITTFLIAIIAFITLLFAAPVFAQAVPPSKPPTCYPFINGYPVGAPQQRVGQYGLHLFWFCSDSKGSKPVAEGISCPLAGCSEALAGQVMAVVTRASGKVGTANAEWAKHVKFDCPAVEKENTARGRLCKERKTFLDQNRVAWGVR